MIVINYIGERLESIKNYERNQSNFVRTLRQKYRPKRASLNFSFKKYGLARCFPWVEARTSELRKIYVPQFLQSKRILVKFRLYYHTHEEGVFCFSHLNFLLIYTWERYMNLKHLLLMRRFNA